MLLNPQILSTSIAKKYLLTKLEQYLHLKDPNVLGSPARSFVPIFHFDTFIILLKLRLPNALLYKLHLFAAIFSFRIPFAYFS